MSTIELTTIDQEIKVWYALATEARIFDNPYTAFVERLTGWGSKIVDLPSGRVSLVENKATDDEDTDEGYIVFSVAGKTYRMDGDEYSSWGGTRQFHSVYEVESKVVTETRYVRI
jgi:hypothetical protein